MGDPKKFFNQTRKPEGRLGRKMIKRMNAGHDLMAKWGMSRAEGYAPENMLEIGCGGGKHAAELMEKYPSAHMTAVDYSELSVKTAAKRNRKMIKAGRCAVMQGDVSKLQFADGEFDFASAFETIYFWPGLEKCFAEVARVLKSGGVFMIVNESDGTDEKSLSFEKIIDGMKNYTAPQIETALKAAGFAEVKSFHHEAEPWIAVFAKK
ncbi:MAG: class I SAM-dependent methyltransferase [Clostridia bacterium]|nr:class I SAM-dependent methyltransferase [Clostridia bacterium]